MKEAFWGVLIVMLGLFGIVAVNLLQSVTVDNDRVYYVIKEATEASAYDSVDLTWYRLNANFRIVEDKFIENLTRRFSQNITAANYQITVYDVNEIPPLVSLMVKSGVSSIMNEKIGIENSVHGIIETKYGIDKITDFLGITKEEWVDKLNSEDTTNYCNNTINLDDDIECIEGDIKVLDWGNSNLPSGICPDDDKVGKNVNINVDYAVCECGKWNEEKEPIVLTSTITKNANKEYIYTWNLNISTPVKQLSEVKKETVQILKCVNNLSIAVPNDIDNGGALGNTDTPHEPTATNEKYIICPSGGIRIPVYKNNAGTINTAIVLHGYYDPLDAANRKLKWTKVDDTGYLEKVIYTNPSYVCRLNPAMNNCLSRATIRTTKAAWEAVKNGGEVVTYVNSYTVDGKRKDASCKVVLYDGYITPTCENITMEYTDTKTMKSDHTPKSANFTDVTWSIDNSNIATIDANTGKIQAKGFGTATVTVKGVRGGKTGTCTATVKTPPKPPTPTQGATEAPIVQAYANSPDYVIDFVIGIDSHGDTYLTKVAIPAGSLKNGQVVKESDVIKLNTVYKTDDKSYYDNYYERALDIHGGTHDSATLPVWKAGENASQKSVAQVKKEEAAAAAAAAAAAEAAWAASHSSGNVQYSSYTNYSIGGVSQPKIVNCFEKNTKIMTSKGLKNIEDITTSDYVLSYNEMKKCNEYSKVSETFIHDTIEDIYEITIGNTVVKSTGNHKFYATETNMYNLNNYLWKQASELKVGEYIKGFDNKNYQITDIKIVNKNTTVYNIEVDGNHNYYISYTGLLVHNKK